MTSDPDYPYKRFLDLVAAALERGDTTSAVAIIRPFLDKVVDRARHFLALPLDDIIDDAADAASETADLQRIAARRAVRTWQTGQEWIAEQEAAGATAIQARVAAQGGPPPPPESPGPATPPVPPRNRAVRRPGVSPLAEVEDIPIPPLATRDSNDPSPALRQVDPAEVERLRAAMDSEDYL